MDPEGNWRESLPEDLRENKTLADVKDVGSLAQQFIDSQQMIGQSIRVPGPDAGEEDMSKFYGKLVDKVPGLIPTPDPENPEVMSALYKKLGRPDDPSSYEHPEGVDPNQVADFARLAHGLGLTNSQYKQVVGTLAQQMKDNEDAKKAVVAEGKRALKQEWGIVYEDNLQLVDSVMKGTGAPKEMLELAASGTLPADTLKWLYNVGKQLGTEGINFNKDESTTRLAPAEARNRAQEILDDSTGPYWNASHPQHREYVQRVVDLNKAALAGGM
jgi:hypothetical protein